MKTRVRYRRARVMVRCLRPKACEACGREGRVELHHYLYIYETSRVRRAPHLALDNTVWLCFRCHRIADMYRGMASDKERTGKVYVALLVKAKEREEVKHEDKKTDEG